MDEDQHWHEERQRRARRRRYIVAAIALVAALALVLPTVAALFPPARGAETSAPRQPGVLVGMSGVSWKDVSETDTPHLWQLITEASVGNLVVRSQRSSACPADGWLAVSAGRRSADLPLDSRGVCRQLEVPSADGQVPGWPAYQASAAAANFGASPGVLGSALADASVAAHGLGPGAAIALSDTSGTTIGPVEALASSPAQISAQVSAAMAQDVDLLVIDVGDLREPGLPVVPVPASQDAPGASAPADSPADDSIFAGQADPADPSVDQSAQHLQDLRALDERLGAVLGALDSHDAEVNLLLASLADPGRTSGLRLLAAGGPALAPEGPGFLSSNSTRQTGLAQTFDITATIFHELDVPPPGVISGSPIETVPGTVDADPAAGIERAQSLADDQMHAAVVPMLAPTFTIALIVINLLVYALATIGFNKKVHRRLGRWLGGSDAGSRRTQSGVPESGVPESGSRARTALRAVQVTALAVAAIPVSAAVANLLPWWRAASPGWALAGAIAVIAGLLAAVALLGPWRRWLFGPLGVIAGVTSAVFALDVIAGAPLQVSNVFGIQPQVGARFYGFNNQTFALFATATLLVAMCAAEPLVRRGRRTLAAAVVLGIGAVQVLINGLPSLGADFGGPPATVPAFLVLALLTAGVRLTWKRVLVIGAATIAVVTTFLVVDWLRPPQERTHLGNFFQTVLDGEAWEVVWRKLSANLSLLFGTPLTLLAVGGGIMIVLVLLQPLRHERTAKAQSRDSEAYGWLTGGPSILSLNDGTAMLRHGLTAVAVALIIGFAVNDSGIVIPAIGSSLLVPLLIAAWAGWLLQLPQAPPAQGSQLAARADRSRAR